MRKDRDVKEQDQDYSKVESFRRAKISRKVRRLIDGSSSTSKLSENHSYLRDRNVVCMIRDRLRELRARKQSRTQQSRTAQ